MASTAFAFQWQPQPNVSQLAESWQQLEAQSPANLFTSWFWMQSWWQAYQKADWLLTVSDANGLVSLSLWNEQHHKRPLGLHVNTLHLHHVGREAEDQIWPEYSSPLTKTESEHLLYPQLLAQLFQHTHINEIDVGLTHHSITQLNPNANYLAEPFLAATAFQYKTNAEQAAFSANLRSQLNRSQREAEKLGTVTFTLQEDPDFTAFEQLAEGHQQQWGESSGFNNPAFLRFHRQLMANSQFAAGTGCAIATLAINGQPYAQHYLIRYHGTLYFYLGTAKKTSNARLKPGMMLHAHLIERLAELGCQCYDFMGGDYEYKRRLSNQQTALQQWRIKRPLARFKVEQTLKQWKARVKTYAH